MLPSQAFGKRLRLLLDENKVSQRAFTQEMGYCETAVSRWILGNHCPGYDTVGAIADRFGVSMDWLFGRTEVRS